MQTMNKTLTIKDHVKNVDYLKHQKDTIHVLLIWTV